MQYLLAIETTCDETAAAVITDELEVRASVVASQESLHERFGGVVPEIASRAHVERILPVVDEAVRRAGIALDDLSAVAVASSPGLAGSLLVGLAAAKALCVALERPLILVNHVQAHIFACRLAAQRDVYPCVGLVISGGHTNLYRCADPLRAELLGSTIDDAAGEAFDKVATLLGLGYPGGPAIEAAARLGNPRAVRLPRPLLDQERLDFSFSGLKTAIRYRLDPPGVRPRTTPPTPGEVADLAASFQEAVVDVLVSKSLAALRQTGLDTLCVGGGVAANRRLRTRLEEVAAAEYFQLWIAPPALCTDNAAMGAIAVEKLRLGAFDPLDADAQPGLERTV